VKVALLGTGKMGATIARKIADAGFELTVWNRTPGKARALGVGSVAPTPGQATAGADVVLSILFGPDSLREVYAQVEPRQGQVFVEMTTAGPEVAEEVAERLEAAGAAFVTAPILGSIPALEQASALILVGGHPASFERVRPVLAAFGQPEHVGSRADSAGLKLVSNAMLHVCNVAAAELMAASRRAGLDPKAAFRLLSRTVPYLQARSRGYLEGSHDRPSFDVTGAVKDQTLMLDLGRRHGAAMPLLAVSRELYAMAEPEYGKQEMTAVIERYPR
jgi:3-hydroxyisobutyrate dehydrogenase-like beta-hydroxyacid dehydrogenase